MGLAALRAGNRSRRTPRRLPRWVKLLAAAVTIAAALVVFGNQFLDVYRLGREAARLQALKRGLQEQNAVLREEMKLLQTPAYIERIAREQLGLVKPGEIAVLIVTPAAQPQAAPSTAKPDNLSVFARMVRAVKRLLSL